MTPVLMSPDRLNAGCAIAGFTAVVAVVANGVFIMIELQVSIEFRPSVG
jgi:hypothetical protein